MEDLLSPVLIPCHHQVITYFGGRVYEMPEGAPGRLSFAGDYLKGDASLLISDLALTDSGEYFCKVKSGGKYHWNTVTLLVLGESHQQGAPFLISVLESSKAEDSQHQPGAVICENAFD